MARNKRFGRSRTLPIAIQDQALRARFPSFKTILWVRDRTVVWEGFLQPTVLSHDYKVRITYNIGRRPKVVVLDPQLKRRSPKERLPHTYAGDELCLYRPSRREWLASELIADKIVPWTSLWLRYYEHWYATGEWLGGGEHPRIVSEEEIAA